VTLKRHTIDVTIFKVVAFRNYRSRTLFNYPRMCTFYAHTIAEHWVSSIGLALW